MNIIKFLASELQLKSSIEKSIEKTLGMEIGDIRHETILSEEQDLLCKSHKLISKAIDLAIAKSEAYLISAEDIVIARVRTTCESGAAKLIVETEENGDLITTEKEVHISKNKKYALEAQQNFTHVDEISDGVFKLEAWGAIE